MSPEHPGILLQTKDEVRCILRVIHAADRRVAPPDQEAPLSTPTEARCAAQDGIISALSGAMSQENGLSAASGVQLHTLWTDVFTWVQRDSFHFHSSWFAQKLRHQSYNEKQQEQSWTKGRSTSIFAHELQSANITRSQAVARTADRMRLTVDYEHWTLNLLKHTGSKMLNRWIKCIEISKKITTMNE